MSMENGLFFAAVVSTYGMPLIVELGVAFDVLVAAILFGVFFFHMRESFDSLDVDRLNRLSEAIEPMPLRGTAGESLRRSLVTLLEITLLAPLVGGLLLAIIGHRPIGGWINVAVGVVTFGASLAMALDVFAHGPQLSSGRMFYIDAFNVYLVVLTAFVGLTTSIFSRPYMRHEVERGRLTDGRLRLYHSMYQGFLFAMLLALSTNNLGVLWVAMEAATLTTVLLVSLYRTPESIEAAWKYFILCGVGIAQALFGTVLLYFAAEQKLGGGRDDTLLWTVLHDSAAQPRSRRCCRSPSCSCWSATAPRSAWCRCTTGCRTRTPRVRRRCRRCSRACCSTSRCTRWCASRCWWTPRCTPHLAGYLMMGFGLLSFMVAGLFLHRQHDIKRMFSYSSIEHMGLMTFAFGAGRAARDLRRAAAHDRALAHQVGDLHHRGARLRSSPARSASTRSAA